jgi:hypothetical protein
MPILPLKLESRWSLGYEYDYDRTIGHHRVHFMHPERQEQWGELSEANPPKQARL